MVISNKGSSVIRSAIEKYGNENQTIVAIEECSELAQALTKALRGQLDLNNLIEEIADVYIMLEQIQNIYQIHINDIVKAVSFKIDRLERSL